jgi:hypothetical protein
LQRGLGAVAATAATFQFLSSCGANAARKLRFSLPEDVLTFLGLPLGGLPDFAFSTNQNK